MSQQKLTEKSIQSLLFDFYNKLGHKLIAPNIYLHYSEADLITVQTSGYVNEIEIKITKADFKGDFKKRKHKYMTESHNGYMRKVNFDLPNYFWFAFPQSLMSKIDFDIPDYYGLITIEDLGLDCYLPCIYRRAKMMHKKKVTNKQIRQIARSMMFKMWRGLKC
jgi:hypothetical protein